MHFGIEGFYLTLIKTKTLKTKSIVNVKFASLSSHEDEFTKRWGRDSEKLRYLRK